MLRLLIIALPLVVALPAAFDEQEVNALQFEVQSPLQFEVRSPPESRPLLPAATQDQHRSPATHSTPRAHHPSAPITIHAPGALERGQDDPPRDQLRHQPLRAQGHQPTTRRCARPCRQPRMQRAQLSVGRAAASARERPVHMLQAHARRPLPRLPQLCARREARRPPRAMQLALAISTRERACFADGLRVAPPVQAAAAASGRARRPSRSRHLRHDRQAQRRKHGHDDPATVTYGVKPVPAVSRARWSSRLRPRRRTAHTTHTSPPATLAAPTPCPS